MPRKARDLTGETFGGLTVLKPGEARVSNGRVRRYWICKCARCGKVVERAADNVRQNNKSCGCHRGSAEYSAAMSAAQRKHGHNGVNSATYRTWQSMRRRCLSPNAVGYEYYGARGIAIDPRWDEFTNFLEDMGERPDGHTLDRIDSDGNYCRENCRWSDITTQIRNRRTTVRLTHEGRTQTLVEWAEEIGMNWRLLHQRICARGWPIDRALTTPVGPYRRNAGGSR